MTSTATDPTISPPRLNHLEPALCAPQGVATISEHIGIGVHVSEIYSRITEDVENFQGCSLDEMLKFFLVHSTGKPQESFNDACRTRLFEECLEKVLPICNGEAQTNDKNDINSSMIKEYLVQYSEAHGKHEDELYLSFTMVANVALQYLQELEIADLRPSKDDSSICFHVTDPSMLRQFHQGQLLERKPDVVAVARSNAYNATGSEQDILFESLTKAPKKRHEWRYIYTFVEFKRSMKMAVPPDRYEISPPQEHEYLRVDARARRPLSKPFRSSARQQERTRATDTDGRKRTSEHLGPPEFQSKRQKFKHTECHPVIDQTSYYAAEMFAAFAAREHAIGLVVIGDILYVWWYDRQHTIQCSGINFIEDLPRFLVLLLAMQRFEAKDWGLNPHVDPAFGPRPPSVKTTLRGDEGKEIQIDFRLSDATRVTHFCLNGRATDMLPVECEELSKDSDIVAKTFWMETMCMSEPEILKRAHEIAETDPDVNGHVPEMLWFKIFHDTSTAKIREHLDLDTEGARVLCVIILRKLRPITELYGNEFLRAWWATVKCHHALWKHGIYHRDVSPSNLMYHVDKQNQIVAVLNDFDMASILATATGAQCTGTVPFMALQLLSKAAFQGNIPHVYEHDAESFIWVLVWISLRYANGTLKPDHDRPLDAWLRVDPIKCRKEKSDFLANPEERDRLQAGEGHEQNWKLAEDCIRILKWRGVEREEAKSARKEENLDADLVFQRLLKVPTSHYLE